MGRRPILLVGLLSIAMISAPLNIWPIRNASDYGWPFIFLQIDEGYTYYFIWGVRRLAPAVPALEMWHWNFLALCCDVFVMCALVQLASNAVSRSQVVAKKPQVTIRMVLFIVATIASMLALLLRAWDIHERDLRARDRLERLATDGGQLLLRSRVSDPIRKAFCFLSRSYSATRATLNNRLADEDAWVDRSPIDTVVGASLKTLNDQNIEEVIQCPQIELLFLDSCTISELGLQSLSRLPNLKVFAAPRTTTPGGLKAIANCRPMSHLYLDCCTSLDDAALSCVTSMVNLEELSLRQTHIGDASGRQLAMCTKLRALYLDNTRVSDRFATYLEDLRNLEELSLAGTAVSDGVVISIRKMKSLRSVTVTGTRVSRAAINELRAARPDLRVQ